MLSGARRNKFSRRASVPKPLVQDQLTAKKTLRISSGALLCRAENALIHFNKLRIARADHPLRIYEAVHVNRDPAAIHEHEVRVRDQPEMVRPNRWTKNSFGCRPRLNTSL